MSQQQEVCDAMSTLSAASDADVAQLTSAQARASARSNAFKSLSLEHLDITDLEQVSAQYLLFSSCHMSALPCIHRPTS